MSNIQKLWRLIRLKVNTSIQSNELANEKNPYRINPPEQLTLSPKKAEKTEQGINFPALFSDFCTTLINAWVYFFCTYCIENV